MYTDEGIPYSGDEITSATSYEAAIKITDKATTLREQVFDLIKASEGLTDSEIQIALNMAGNTERPRRRELQQAHRIIPTGVKIINNRKCIVWRAV